MEMDVADISDLKSCTKMKSYNSCKIHMVVQWKYTFLYVKAIMDEIFDVLALIKS